MQDHAADPLISGLEFHVRFAKPSPLGNDFPRFGPGRVRMRHPAWPWRDSDVLIRRHRSWMRGWDGSWQVPCDPDAWRSQPTRRLIHARVVSASRERLPVSLLSASWGTAMAISRAGALPAKLCMWQVTRS